MANSVARQNEQQQLRRLAAQRRLYSLAKRWYAVDVILAVVVPPVWSLITNMFPASKPYSALWGISAGLTSSIFVSSRISQLRESAARVQEEFDCAVFELDWDEIGVGDHASSELITQAARRGIADPRLTDWYASAVYDLPIAIARLICQRANAWWDRHLRRRYTAFITAIALLVSIIVLTLGVAGGATLEDFILTIIAPLTPTAIFLARYLRENHQAGERAEHLQRVLSHAWKSALGRNADERAITESSRRLQSLLYKHRKTAPLVFDTVYWLLRSRQEKDMRICAEDFVREYLHSDAARRN